MKRKVKRHKVSQPKDKSIRLIPLTQGQNAVIDADDFERVSKHNWRAVWLKNNYYAYTTTIGNVVVAMHSFIKRTKRRVDHVNPCATLDNRKSNLRVATASQNQCNRGKTKANTSGYKGVSKNGKNWMALICVMGVKHYLGTRKNPELAAKLYRKAAKEFHGEFARIV
jgi:hypothetical protein